MPTTVRCPVRWGVVGALGLSRIFLMVTSKRMLRDQMEAAVPVPAAQLVERVAKVAGRQTVSRVGKSKVAQPLSPPLLQVLSPNLLHICSGSLHAIRFHAAYTRPPACCIICTSHWVDYPSLSLFALSCCLCLARCRAHISLLLPSQLAVNTKYNCLTVHKNEEIKETLLCVCEHRVSIELSMS